MRGFLAGAGAMFVLVYIVVGFIALMIKLNITPPPMTLMIFFGMLTGGITALATLIWIVGATYE